MTKKPSIFSAVFLLIFIFAFAIMNLIYSERGNENAHHKTAYTQG